MVYALLMFVLTMLVVLIPIWLITFFPEPRKSSMIHPIFRLWMGVYMPLIFCPVFRKGKNKFKKGEQYVVILNHNSMMDIPVSSPWIPGPNKTLAKVEMAKTPLFGIIYRAGSILVDRKQENSRRESFAKMQETLEMGIHLCLYPEGTRNKTDQPMQPFFDGAFITAIKTQKPVMPGVMFNTGIILPHKNILYARPKPVHIHFLDPIPTTGLTLNDVAGLKQKAFEVMEKHFLSGPYNYQR